MMYGNVTDAIRELMDEAPVAVVLLGTPQLLELEAADSHLANRVSARFELRGLETPAVWHAFVRSFVRQAQSVDLSGFALKEEAQRLYVATQGNLRSFKRLLTEAALVAVDDGARSVSPQHLHKAFERVNGKAAGKDSPYAS